MKWAAGVLAASLVGIARVLTGVQARWSGCTPAPGRRIYLANHSSHADIILIWAALPPALREKTRPVAGADYWYRTIFRRFLIDEAIRAVLVDRSGRMDLGDPIETMASALDAGYSLILFPEGTRNTSDAPLLAFKSGIYWLSCRCPDVELIPTWIANVGRVLPKGATIPLPMLCSVTFGNPLERRDDEPKDAFLQRARDCLLALGEQAQPGAIARR